jgi:hypothetical protein
MYCGTHNVFNKLDPLMRRVSAEASTSPPGRFATWATRVSRASLLGRVEREALDTRANAGPGLAVCG